MDIKDYKFKVGDIIITTEGDVGNIIDICDCKNCRERGFNEIVWVSTITNSKDNYITISEAKNGFPSYYRIGDYTFRNHIFEERSVMDQLQAAKIRVERLEEKLRVIRQVRYLNELFGTKCNITGHEQGTEVE